MRHLVIDDHGDIRPGQLVWAEIGPQLTFAAFEEFCVRNMGFVCLTETWTGLRLHWRPTVVTHHTQSAMLRWLATAAPNRVLVTTEGSHPSVNLCSDGIAAAKLVMDILKQVEIDSPDMRRKRIPLVDLDDRHAFGALVERWRNAGGVYRPDEFKDLLNTTFGRRFVTLEPAEGTSDLFVREVGDGFSILDKSWFRQASGRRFSDQPDVRYGYWATQAYRDALSSAEPVLENVDIILKQPRQNRVRATYDRIILPCTTPDGRRLLLGATLMGDSRVVE